MNGPRLLWEMWGQMPVLSPPDTCILFLCGPALRGGGRGDRNFPNGLHQPASTLGHMEPFQPLGPPYLPCIRLPSPTKESACLYF